MENKEALNKAYENVRKAYRLIYEVQDSTLCTIKSLAENIDYDAKYGSQGFSDSLKRSNEPIWDIWAWDYIPSFSYQYYFYLKNSFDIFSIIQVMDDGFTNPGLNVNIGSSPSTEQFNAAIDSKSQVYLVLTKTPLIDEKQPIPCEATEGCENFRQRWVNILSQYNIRNLIVHTKDHEINKIHTLHYMERDLYLMKIDFSDFSTFKEALEHIKKFNAGLGTIIPGFNMLKQPLIN